MKQRIVTKMNGTFTTKHVIYLVVRYLGITIFIQIKRMIQSMGRRL